jgi:hypothetical protein
MKKHHLWGRKTPGPYTRTANHIFGGIEDGIEYTGEAANTVVGTSMLAGGALMGGASAVSSSMLDGAASVKDWADETREINFDKDYSTWPTAGSEEQ